MELQTVLNVLIDLAEEIGIVVRRMPAGGESNQGRGGALIRLKGKEMLFLDPSASLTDQVSVLAGVLARRREVQERYLPPEVRRWIEASQPGQ